MKLALEDGDRPTQGKCLCCFADIHRNGNDVQARHPRYEAAVSIMVEIGDRYGQIEALSGMAKTMLAMKQINKALDYNAKALDLANNIGNKMHMLRCRILLTDIYRLVGDTRMVAEEQCRCRRLQEDMQLICRACNKCLGESPNHLEFLPCCHLVHNRCAYETTRRSSSKNNRSSKFISCPTCSKDVPKDSVYL
ncbi:hypothetical protein NP493_1496g00017 [Ridgeia piscesae]|uniref:RING-type domain-containing protein n=1 Tax=Ridgeia piscesae TaxID=27915 RepID=A0AAD9K0X2_RIDPI|nr:hypothetical protein NP493_1496g00017 [Ridgeia piscesae]